MGHEDCVSASSISNYRNTLGILEEKRSLSKINISSWCIFLTERHETLCPQFYDKDVKLQSIFRTLTCCRIYQGIYKPDVCHSTPNPVKWVTWGKVFDKDSLKKSIIIQLETLTTLILKVPFYLTCFLGLLNTRAGNDLKLEHKISPRFTEVKYLYSITLIPKIFMRFQIVCS